jgi:hypothetical protein
VSGYLSITKRPITITADEQTKMLGDEDPDLTYNITQGNLVNDDTFSGNLVRELGETIGSYLIKLGTLMIGSGGNYDVSYVESNFIITTTAGIMNSFVSKQIDIYPNPTTNFLNIETKGQLFINEIVVYNLIGKVVKKEKNITNGIQLQGLSKGAYILKMITDKGVAIKRIVKE